MKSALVLKQCEMHAELGHFENAEILLRDALGDERLVSTTNRPDLLYTALGKTLRRLPNRTKEAGDAFETAAKLMEGSHEIPVAEQSSFLNSYGNFSFQMGDLDKAISAHKKALELDISIDDLEGAAVALGNLANTYLQRADFAEAEDNIRKAIDIERSRKLSRALTQSLQIRGLIAFIQNKIADAIPSYEEALELSRENGQVLMETKALSGLATCSLRSKDYEDARKFARQAIRNAYDNGHLSNAAGAMRTMSVANQNLLKIRSAVRLIRAAYEIHLQTQNWLEVTQDLLVLAELKFTLGQDKQAIYLANEAKKLAQNMGQQNLMQGADWLIQKIQEISDE